MQLEMLAKAVGDARFRESLMDQMSSEEVSAFEEYVSDYEAADSAYKKDGI